MVASHRSLWDDNLSDLHFLSTEMPQVVETFAQARSACLTHSIVVSASGASLGLLFSFLRIRHRFPGLLKRNKTVLPALTGCAVIVGVFLQRYSHASCLERYASRYPEEAADWARAEAQRKG
ncbi:hypothetical protein DFJ73DRAFT_811676 [Zopfochytrium polystomum]|nr:hypothetical protein DFJ73DRAFT_811676 [Zopfochytrium polystomum]